MFHLSEKHIPATLTCIFLLFASTVTGQQLTDTVKLKATAFSTINSLVFLPDDYRVTNTNYPVIIYLHGKSKSGNDISKLRLEGVPYWISRGKKIQARNPADGKLYKFIVVSPQAPSWGLKPAEIERMLNDVASRYRIDPKRIYITGYSAGGWATVMALTEKPALTARFAAAVPMSVATIDDKNKKNFKMVADAKVHCWYLAGEGEPHFMEDCMKYVDSTNKYGPGLAKMTIVENFAHKSWISLYDPANKHGIGMNIYEWMLQYRK
ncbi:prolyl oligopeptidase family serine peptidase [Chitinophaga pollutisoli]|uniref:Prolyl oligopeptidase family serine peptidase n=1 Tax=Chitinophaga pollutisoli TaxID=3133966 RepID=A0ABZ2YPQ0_9BACT